MKEFLESNRLLIILMVVIFAFSISFGYIIGSHNGSVHVSVGDAKIQVGEKNLPMESALAEIYNQTAAIPQLTQDVTYLLHSTRMDMVRNILRQYSMIRNNPNNVLTIDVVRCLEDWHQLPEAYKTGDLPIKYEFIKEWYEKRTKEFL